MLSKELIRINSSFSKGEYSKTKGEFGGNKRLGVALSNLFERQKWCEAVLKLLVWRENDVRLRY